MPSLNSASEQLLVRLSMASMKFEKTMHFVPLASPSPSVHDARQPHTAPRRKSKRVTTCYLPGLHGLAGLIWHFVECADHHVVPEAFVNWQRAEEAAGAQTREEQRDLCRHLVDTRGCPRGRADETRKRIGNELSTVCWSAAAGSGGVETHPTFSVKFELHDTSPCSYDG